jgi:mercuric ion binding protein
MKPTPTLLGAAFLLGLAVPPRPVRAQEPGRVTSPAAVAAGPERITVTVTGLSCPFCAYGLEKRLKKIEGLDSLNIGFKTGAVTLYVRDGSTVSDERIRRLVKDGGFEATKIERAAGSR